jgi:hypothetical protein
MIIEHAWKYSVQELDIRAGDIIVTDIGTMHNEATPSINFVLSIKKVSPNIVSITYFRHQWSAIQTIDEYLDETIPIITTLIGRDRDVGRAR